MIANSDLVLLHCKIVVLAHSGISPVLYLWHTRNLTNLLLVNDWPRELHLIRPTHFANQKILCQRLYNRSIIAHSASWSTLWGRLSFWLFIASEYVSQRCFCRLSRRRNGVASATGWKPPTMSSQQARHRSTVCCLCHDFGELARLCANLTALSELPL